MIYEYTTDDTDAARAAVAREALRPKDGGGIDGVGGGVSAFSDGLTAVPAFPGAKRCRTS